jgi:predicted methyltransferase
MDLKDQTTLSANPIDQQGFQVFHWWSRGKEQEYEQETFDIEPFVRWH